MLIAPNSFRSGIDSNMPAVGLPFFIDTPAKIPDQEVAPHL